MIKIEELIEKAKYGNKEACVELIEGMRSDLYRIALSKLRNEEDAKDVVQETITNAYFAIQGKEDLENFKAWITTILINECKAVYKKRKRNDEIDDKLARSNETVSYLDDDIYFDELIENLKDKEKQVFELHYKYEIKAKDIAKRLGMSESNVKTILSRGRVKLKNIHKRTSLFIAILCVLVATSVIAISLVKYIQGLFEVSSIGADNNGVLMAIEHMDWYQEIDMSYIELSEGYKVRAEYLMMDEMNLYMVLDIKSEEDISKFTDIEFANLKMSDENGKIIYDKRDILGNYYAKAVSTKIIEKNKNNMKVLVYMYTDSFPISNTLYVSFSKIMFLGKPLIGAKKFEDVIADVDFKIELDDKFINRKYTSYNSENANVEKAIITETGFYAIVKQNRNEKIVEAKLIDENGNSYECYWNLLTDYNVDTKDNLKYIILTDLIDNKSTELKLVINGTEYILTK